MDSKISNRKAAFREEALATLSEIDGDPTEVQAQNIYKLDCYACSLHDGSNPKSSNCRDNPYCINRLGLEKFDKLLKDETKKARTNISEQVAREIATQPCGLTNSGNFCYVNSFLQVFFNDPVFRQMVYDWRPIEGFVRPEGTIMDVQAVMNCLQKIFFFLDNTPYEDTSTFTFTNLLRLQNAQQDAQEFTIMFFDVLCHRLTSHPNGKTFVDRLKQRYYGKTKTRTWCKCGGRDNQEIQPFMSLQIPIDGFKALNKAMEHHFAVETLHECRCHACGKMDQVCRQTEIYQLPEVLIIQLNRYTNDIANGCQRKLRSPLAYPRTIEARTLCHALPPEDDSVYELFAVMIHEGENTHCGHYYDLIKHPFSDQWFKYNDNVVEALAKTPGFDARANTSKPTSDMKACYGLLYRRKAPIEPCTSPPAEITDPWRAEYETDFAKDTGEAITKSENREAEVRKRYTELNNVFESLKAHTDRYKNFKNLAFIPLELLTNVLEMEMVYAKKMLKEIEAEDGLFPKRRKSDQGMAATPVKRSRGRKRSAREEIAVMLKPTSMKLCPHGLVSVESVLYGDVKVVARTACENLLSRYNFTVKRSSGMGETPGAVLTGKDICLDCLKTMKEEATFKDKVEETAKLAQRILKEKLRDSTNLKHKKPDDHFYVSRKCLMNFKKLAEQQWRYSTWVDDEQRLLFIPNSLPTVGVAASVPTVSTNGVSRGKRKLRSSSVEPSTTCGIREKEDDESVVGAVVAHLVDSVSRLANGFRGESHEASTEPKMSSDQEQNGTSEAGGSSRPPTPLSSIPEEIVFNSLLKCPHDGINIPEFRFSVSPEEWEQLTEYFPSCFVVGCADPICMACVEQEEEARADHEERSHQKRQLARQFGDFTRNLDRRVVEKAELGVKYQHGICSRFVCAMRDAFKRSSEVFDLPQMCQDCLMCPHGKPFKTVEKPPYSSEDPSIVPIQRKEYDQLLAQWPPERVAEINPVRILEGGAIENFCEECHESHVQMRRLDRLVFEDQNVFVQLDDGTTQQPPTKRAVSRRAAQKNIFKVKMSSSDKVVEIKVKLYTKIHQTPKDQLLYHNGRLLDDGTTLFDAGIEPNNSESPLRLVVHQTFQPPVNFNEDRELEMGFTGTALTY